MLPVLLLFTAILVIALPLIAILQERHTISRLQSTARSRPRLLVFDFPDREPDRLALAATIDELRRQWRNAIEITPVHVFDQLEYAARFGLYRVPTTILLDARGGLACVNEGDVSLATLWKQLSGVAAPPPHAVPPLDRIETDSQTQPRSFQARREELPCQS